MGMAPRCSSQPPGVRMSFREDASLVRTPSRLEFYMRPLRFAANLRRGFSRCRRLAKAGAAVLVSRSL